MPFISIEDGSAVEGSNLGITVRLSEASINPITVSYRVLTGTPLGSFGSEEIVSALDGGEILTLSFDPGETVKALTIGTVRAGNDTSDEVDETFTVEIFDPVNADLAANANVLRATAIILDNDGTGNNTVLIVGSPILLEGDSGTQTARFQVQLSRALASDVTLDYSTLDGSAKAGEDYVAANGSLTFVAGQTSQFIDVEVNGDDQPENTESFFLRVSPPGIAPSTATNVGEATIINDDTMGAGPSISIEAQPTVEGEIAAITVRLSEASINPVTVSGRVLTGTPLGSFGSEEIVSAIDGGEEFTITFDPGETTKSFRMGTVRSGNDFENETDETFTFELFDPVNAELAGGVGVLRETVIVLDNDGATIDTIVSVSSPILVEGDEDSTVARFEVQLSRPLATSVTMDFATIDGTALAGEDYLAQTGTITFLSGQTSQFIDVPVLADNVIEASESFFLHITPPGIAPSTATNVGEATIVNDDTASSGPSISIEALPATEGELASVTFRLSEASFNPVSLSYRFLTGGPLGSFGAEEVVSSLRGGQIFTLTFDPGETVKNFYIGTVRSGNDFDNETDETFTIEAFDPVYGELAGGAAALRDTIFVLDNDGTTINTIVSVSSPILVEGDDGNTLARFEVQLSRPLANDISLAYSTLDGTALAGKDYAASTGELTFLAGQTSAIVDVIVFGDTQIEAAETFSLRVTPPGIAPSTATNVGEATIVNDDTAGSGPSISIEALPATEGELASVTFRLSEESFNPVSVSARFLTGSSLGTFGADEIPSSVDGGEIFTVTFAPGETVKNFYIGTVRSGNDFDNETDETFTVEAFDPVNGELAGGAIVLRDTITVLDDDGNSIDTVVTVGDPIIVEGDNATALARFEIQLSRPLTTDISLDFEALSGTALAGEDFVARAGAVTFLSGQTSAYVDVEIIGDEQIENSESFYLYVTPPGIAPSIASNVGKATIVNDDTNGVGPSLSIEALPAVEGAFASFTFRLNEPSINPISVSGRFLTGDTLGSVGNDELPASVRSGQPFTISFAPGETVKNFGLAIGHDFDAEVDETYTIEAFDAVNAELAGDAALLRLTNFVMDIDGTGTDTIVAVSNPLITEGDFGSRTVLFEVMLSRPLSNPTTIAYTTLDGSATAGSDYVAASGSLTFAPGQTSAFVPVEIIGDLVIEGDETFSLHITPPGVAPSTATSTGTATILNDNDGGNKAPVLAISQAVETPEDVTVQIAVSAIDPNGDALTYSATSPGHGALAGGAAGVFSYTPALNYNGSDTFVVTVSDGKGGVSTQRIDLTITPVNDAPLVAATQAVITNLNLAKQVTVTALDPEGDPFTYSAGEAQHGSISGGAGGVFVYTPDTGYIGSDSFFVSLEDDGGAVSTQNVQVSVLPPNNPPTLLTIEADYTAFLSAVLKFLVQVTDLDGDALSFSATSPLHGLLTIGLDGLFTYVPNAGYLGPDSFSIFVNDGNGGIVTQTIQISVINPIISDDWRLFASDGFTGSVGGSGQVYGTAGFQDITVLDEAGLVAFDPSFNKGGDIIRLSGNAAEWQVIRSGSSALFVDGDTFVQLSIGTAGTPIVFDDGMRSLRYDSGAATMKIGSQAFGTAFVTVTADPDGTLLPTGADAAADARLFLAAGTSASAGGKIGIFGTASTELLSLLSGTISLDPSFNKGGDIISFNLPATDFLASRVGSSVLLDSATTDALIPIGTTGTTLTFTDGDDRYVLYDSTIPGVLIGDQIITGTPSALMAFG